MSLTFRIKLILLVVWALLSLVFMIVGSDWIGVRNRSNLDNIEGHLVPRMDLAPRLESELTRLGRAMQDAVSAQDLAALEGTSAIKSNLVDAITAAGPALDPSVAASLRWTIQDYFESARKVSEMLIRDDMGEPAVHAIAEMQRRQQKAEEAIRNATLLDREELSRAFAEARQSSLTSSRFRMVLGTLGIAGVLGLWFWASRQVLRALSALSTGFAQFSTGDFNHTIPVQSNDELGEVAREANSMATSLKELAHIRDRGDWIKTRQAELSEELRGNLEPILVAQRTLACLVRHTSALAGAIYLLEDDEHLGLASSFASSDANAVAGFPTKRFRIGEGLVGQAQVSRALQVIEEPPPAYFEVLSGLGRGAPRTLVLFPLARNERCIGVVELALLGDLSEPARELLASIQDLLVTTFDAANARAEVDALLDETQRQAERLTQQEEELRLNNQELSAQQEELRRTNEELEEQREELGERNEELNRARDRVEHQVEELGRVSLYKSQFLANMSHELRTPLNSMLLLSHLMAENQAQNLTPKQVEYCSTIHSAGKDLLELINQVLDLSKIEAGRQETDHQWVPLEPLADSMRRIFEPLAHEKNLQLVVEIASGTPESIWSDRSRIERIVTNLLGNAIKFTERGKVTLRIGLPDSRGRARRSGLDPDDAIAFVVSDTGIGIPAEEHERVFVPFEQIEASTSRRYQGTGLGLSIARESARLLGGELSLESTANVGSTFSCILPRKKPSGADVAATTTSDDAASPRPAHSHPRAPTTAHVLVIEDDPVLAEQLEDIIHSRGLEALTASTGADGIALAKQHRPCGIVLDVKLPDVDGWTVLERLRNDPETRDIPVHFLSAIDAPDAGLSRGAIGYLTKPATRAELSELIRNLTPNVGVQSQKILVVEDSTAEGQSIVALLGTENFEAQHVTSAEAALNAVAREKFGCVILDLGLPDLDGLGLLEAVRTRPDFSGTRVIVHTGRSLTKRETRQLEAYSQAIILKDGNSSTRLLEEIRLFVHHVRENVGAPADSREVDHASGPSLVGTRILVVEDDMRTVYSLSALLQSRGSEVVVAENGREALELLDGGTEVQCVLMDIMMPEMDGYETMRRLRATDRFEALPIIALTAKAMVGERDRCLAAGASDYLSKPVDSAKLLAAIRTWIDARGVG